jgi:hypothetical protein
MPDEEWMTIEETARYLQLGRPRCYEPRTGRKCTVQQGG